MKKYAVLVLLAFSSFATVVKAEKEVEQLPKPETIAITPLIEVFMRGNYSNLLVDKPFSAQDTSNLLWAVFGIHRYGAGRKSDRSFQNWQHYSLLISTTNGIFNYDPFENHLELITRQPMQKTFSEFKNYSFQIILVIDKDSITEKDPLRREFIIAMNSGVIYQKTYLVCAAQKWANYIHLPGPWLPKLRKILKLKSNHTIAFVHSVGYAKAPRKKPVTYPFYSF